MSDECRHRSGWIYGTGSGTVCEGCGKDAVLIVGKLQAYIAQLEQWKVAVDDALVAAHIATADSFESPRHAVNALCSWSESVGEYFAKEAQPAPTDEPVTVELGDGGTAVSDVYYGSIAGVAFSQASGKVGEIHPAATTDDLEGMFLRILSDNPDSLAVVKAAFTRAEATLRAALQGEK